MKNINLANKLVFDLYEEGGLYKDIIPKMKDGLPELAHYRQNGDREIYLFFDGR